MTSLQGSGILVTRPQHQSGDLITAIEDAGGRAYPFPVIDIEGRAAEDIRRDEQGLPSADIVIFVSSNAVIHGIGSVDASRARLAAVGPATRKAIESSGHAVSIFPEHGFDSESLLEAAELQDVAGNTIRIVRGEGGRELLADSLRQRGARVDYLETYRRRAHEFSTEDLSLLQQSWLGGDIHCVIAMSVDSLEFFLAALPPPCRAGFSGVSLVTPSSRVIHTALDKSPGMQTVLAAGPGTDDMLEALIACRQQGAGTQ